MSPFMHSSIYKCSEYIQHSSHKEFSPYTAKNHIVLFASSLKKSPIGQKGIIYIYVSAGYKDMPVILI